MKKGRKSVILTAALSIALCVSVAVGATFALFATKDEVNIAATAANVKVTATIDNVKAHSPAGIANVKDGAVITDPSEAARDDNTFAAGGKVVVGDDGLTLDRMAAGDSVSFRINIKNYSNIDTKYRTIVSCAEDNGLFDGLEMQIGDDVTASVSEWQPLPAASAEGDTIDTIDCKITLPSTAGTAYDGKSCKISFKVESVQSNAETKTYTLDEFNALTAYTQDIYYVDLGDMNVKYGERVGTNDVVIGNVALADDMMIIGEDGKPTKENTWRPKYYGSYEEAAAAPIPAGYKIHQIRGAGGDPVKYTVILETVKKPITLIVKGQINVTDTPAMSPIDLDDSGSMGVDITFKVPGASTVICDGLEINGFYRLHTNTTTSFISAVFNNTAPRLVMKNCNLNGSWLSGGMNVNKVTFANCTFDTMALASIKNTNPIWWRLHSANDIKLLGCTVKSILPVKFEDPCAASNIVIDGCTFDVKHTDTIYASDTRNFGVLFGNTGNSSVIGFENAVVKNNNLINETAGVVAFYSTSVYFREGGYLILNDNDVVGGKPVQIYKTAVAFTADNIVGNDYNN